MPQCVNGQPHASLLGVKAPAVGAVITQPTRSLDSIPRATLEDALAVQECPSAKLPSAGTPYYGKTPAGRPLSALPWDPLLVGVLQLLRVEWWLVATSLR